MCGIAGVLCFDADAQARARAVAASMRRAIAHRGPDGDGLSVVAGTDTTVALAHARLAIIDLSDGGRQPMQRGPLTVTYNGEIYNYRALRDELAGHGESFRTDSDTEVLLAALTRWGTGALDRIEGMFAFAVWNASDHSLLLARDRLGIKPLYYAALDEAVVFASEVRALLASGLVPAELDPDSLWHYFGYQTAPTPLTLIRGVRLLEPGHWAEVGRADRTVRVRRYWDLMESLPDAPEVRSIEAARTGTRDRLLAAIESHLVSDVPVGVFLSGGIDSGALAALVRATGATPQTFSIVFNEAEFDESETAREIARHYRADHTELRVRGSDLQDLLPDVLAAIDHPSGDGVNAYVVARLVRERGLKVALSGLGGDEIFGGYPSFDRLPRLMPAMRRWGKSPTSVRRAAAGMVRTIGGGSVAATKLASVMESEGTVAAVWPVTRQIFSDGDRRRLLREPWTPAPELSDRYEPLLRTAYSSAPDADLWAAVSYAEARTYMHDVLLRDTDQMSMAHALEVRVPLLDHRLVSFVCGLPASLKEGERPKALLADSLPDPLPSSIRNQPKRGFTLPFDPWMRTSLRGFCEAQLGERGLAGRGLFRPGQLETLWNGFLHRAPGLTWSRIWLLVALNAWMERNHVKASGL